MGVSLTSYPLIDHLAGLISRGLPIGKALADFHRLPHARETGRQMCLLGDPRVRLPVVRTSHNFDHGVTGRVTTLKAPPAQEMNAYGKVSFLRACLEVAGAKISETVVPLHRKAMDAVRAYELALWRDEPLECGLAAPGPVMRQTMREYLTARTKLIDDWMTFARIGVGAASGKPCFVCGKRTKTFEAGFSIPGVSRRRLTSCPRCGYIEDVPMESYLTTAVVNGTGVRLAGKVPREHVTAGIYFWSPQSSLQVDYPWPQDSNGALLDEFHTPKPWPPGPLRVTVFVLWGANVAVFNQYARGALASVDRECASIAKLARQCASEGPLHPTTEPSVGPPVMTA
jgi:hypothetical protein